MSDGATPGGLEIRGLCAGYGETVVLEELDLELAPGDALAVLGRNGVGKTTLLASIAGHTTRHAGTIRLGGVRLETLAPHRRTRAGIGFVPQEREIFASLTVLENLRVAQRAGGWTVERVYALFPSLRRRAGNRGHALSGGEQQMLAIGRALMTGPRVLLLDEPLEGLAPVVVDELLAAIRTLKTSGGPIVLIVEQKASLALEVADRAIVLERGRVVHAGASAELAADTGLLEQLLGVH